MNILITNHALHNVGGTETWVITMANEMIMHFHDVEVCTPSVFGPIANRLEGTIKRTVVPSREEYDLILTNTVIGQDLAHGVRGFRIHTVHGAFIWQEFPPKVGADVYVSISQEIKDALSDIGVESTLIYNPVEIWDSPHSYSREIADTPETFLSLSVDERLNKFAEEVCGSMGIRFISRNKHTNPTMDIMQDMMLADIVMAVGRGAYEALSHGRAVIAGDLRQYAYPEKIMDGMLDAYNIEGSLMYNCTGRYAKIPIGYESLEKAIKEYHPGMGEWNRQFAKERFDAMKVADQYLDLMP